ncbi:MAG: hypothetical protein WBB70_15265 [Desulfobacterales bacterium]|jgi:hypothetical protein
MTTIIGIISKKLKDRGLVPVEINRLIKDVANVISSGKYCTPVCVKQNLERLGWEGYVVDNYILELIFLFLNDQKLYRNDL